MAPKKKKGKFQNKETPTVDSFYETMPKKKEKKGSRRFTAVILIIVLLVLGLPLIRWVTTFPCLAAPSPPV